MRLLAVTAVGLGLAISSVGGAAHSRGAGEVGPPPGLTQQGRLLWNFEAILRDTFSNRSAVSVTTGLNESLNFSCPGWCGPNAKYLHYRFTFARARGSAFHVSKKRYVGGTWGNYPRGILIRGHLIACDADEKQYLISWVFRSTASFTLGCSGDPLGR